MEAGRGFCLESWWRSVVVGATPWARLWRPVLWILSVPWAAVVRTSHLLYRWRLLHSREAQLPIVSVGNISVGGTGKTTVCMYIAARLLEMDVTPAIVLRGHRRKSTGAFLVSDGEKPLADAALAGDEAWLLAQQLPRCPVAVATSREQAISMIAERTAAQVVLLDDGFQYYRLARQVDLVLLDAFSHGGSDRLMPAGQLREPYSHLVRATDIWITHADLACPERRAALERLVNRYGRSLVLVEHAINRIVTLQGETVDPQCLIGRRTVAVAGLGNPESFFAMLERDLGHAPIAITFPDHHHYEQQDWVRVETAVAGDRGVVVVTTPKDAVKLPAPPPGLDVFVVHPRLQVCSGQACVDEMLQRIQSAIVDRNRPSG